jgi:hypothetical protein
MENFARDHRFAFRAGVVEDTQKLDSIGDEVIITCYSDGISEARRRVRGWCKGLVEVRRCAARGNQKLPLQKHYQYVTFAHRSVVEFLL